MTLQNRVDPFGRFHAAPARGTLMGNRGILHDDRKTVLRTHRHRNWVACALSCKGIRRQIMAPRRYTELFFLDEATALAAGHRPCAFCRRDRYLAFTRAWETAYGGANEGQSLPRTIDAMLHKARIDRQGRKVTHAAACATLPDGTIFLEGEDVRLVWEGKSLGWSFDGYTSGRPVPRGQVEVLTPEPVIAVLKCGYRVQPHDSLGGAT